MLLCRKPEDIIPQKMIRDCISICLVGVGRRDGLTRELLDVVAQACEKRWNVNRTEDERLFWKKQSSEHVFIVTRY